MEYKLSSFQFDQQIARDDKHLAITVINDMRPACPYDSVFTGEFNKNGTGFNGQLRIHFSRGEFRVSAKASNMAELMKDLTKQVNHQVELWRDHRFVQEDTFVEFYKKVK